MPLTTLSVESQFFKLVGATVRTYDEQRQLLCKAEQKAFRLKEQITFFADEAKQQPLFHINARNIIDVRATYDITDAQGQRVGSLRRKGLASTFVRDEWVIMDAQEQEVGAIREDSQLLGAFRRYVDFVALFFPQKFHIYVGDQPAAEMQLNRFFGMKLQCSLSPTVEERFGRTLALAIPSLLIIIEGRQS